MGISIFFSCSALLSPVSCLGKARGNSDGVWVYCDGELDLDRQGIS